MDFEALWGNVKLQCFTLDAAMNSNVMFTLYFRIKQLTIWAHHKYWFSSTSSSIRYKSSFFLLSDMTHNILLIMDLNFVVLCTAHFMLEYATFIYSSIDNIYLQLLHRSGRISVWSKHYDRSFQTWSAICLTRKTFISSSRAL